MAEHPEEEESLFSEMEKWANLAIECNQSLLESSLEKFTNPQESIDTALGSLSSFAQSVLNSDPRCLDTLIDKQLQLIHQQLSLVETTMERLQGKGVEPVIKPLEGDQRFTDEEWTNNPFFDFIKQSYLLNTQALKNMVEDLSLADNDKEKVNFYLRQISSALAPTNFPLSNPEIVRQIQESKGTSLFKGLKQLVQDQKKSSGFLSVCMSDQSSFVLGENIACTAGKVIFENELMQLIQYQPVCKQVYETPLLFIPSWVNKFYVYDLREKNSLVKWALEQGYTVFMVSWVNPGAEHRHLGFDDYLQQGPLTAIEHIKNITGANAVNAIGYCLGGVLLAATAAYLSKLKDDSLRSATYLTTSFDFTNPGDLRVMLDDYVIDGVSQLMEKTGYVDGRSLGVSFALLRENELYWNYYIQNYLKGERPSGFDILHWNCDSTNLTQRMHEFVLKKLVQGNIFMRAEGVEVLGESIHLRDITIPTYILATERDHIARWQSCFAGARVQQGPNRFVLAGSGHIAGVINPPSSNKYHYYAHGKSSNKTGSGHSLKAEQWLARATRQEGSWWPDWDRWLGTNSGKLRPAITIDRTQVIEEAPGRYVKRRLDHPPQADANTNTNTNTNQAA